MAPQNFTTFAEQADWGAGIALFLLMPFIFAVICGFIGIYTIYRLCKLYLKENSLGFRETTSQFKAVIVIFILSILYLLHFKYSYSSKGTDTSLLRFLPTWGGEWDSVFIGVCGIVISFILAKSLPSAFPEGKIKRLARVTKQQKDSNSYKNWRLSLLVSGVLLFTPIAPAAAVTSFVSSYVLLRKAPYGSISFIKTARFVSCLFLLIAILLTFKNARTTPLDCSDNDPISGNMSYKCREMNVKTPHAQTGIGDVVIGIYALAGTAIFVLSLHRQPVKKDKH